MLKILFDCALMKNRDSGLFYYCLNLCNSINEIFKDDKNIKFQSYIPEKELKNQFINNHTIVEKKWHKNSIYFKINKYDIFHAPFQSGRILGNASSNAKVVLTIHDLNCLYEDISERNRKESLDHTQALINRADSIVCISDFCKNDVVSNLNINNKPITTIYNGNGMENLPVEEKILGYRPSLPFIFSIGFVNRKKNFHVLLPLLNDPNIELVISGKIDDPDYAKRILDEAEKLGVSERLHITGSITEEEKVWFYRNCYAFAHPSIAEGFGLTVIEAMSFGKPVFLSNRTSLPEIGGDLAFYFPDYEPNTIIERFKEGMKSYKTHNLENRLIERAKLFSWKKSAEKYVEVYTQLL